MYLIFMSQIVLYFLHSTLVLSVHIDVVLTLSSTMKSIYRYIMCLKFSPKIWCFAVWFPSLHEYQSYMFHKFSMNYNPAYPGFSLELILEQIYHFADTQDFGIGHTVNTNRLQYIESYHLPSSDLMNRRSQFVCQTWTGQKNCERSRSGKTTNVN